MPPYDDPYAMYADAQEQESLLRRLGHSALSGLGWLGETLSKPLVSITGTLAGQPSSLLNLIPFSDTLGITDPTERVYGRDLLRKYGLAGKEDTWGNFAGGLAIDTLLDPLSYLGIKPLTEAGKAMSKVSKAVPRTADFLGSEVARLTPELQQVMKTGNALTPEGEAFLQAIGRKGVKTPPSIIPEAGELPGVKARYSLPATGLPTEQVPTELRKTLGFGQPFFLPESVFGDLGSTKFNLSELPRWTGMPQLSKAAEVTGEVLGNAAKLLPESVQNLPTMLKGLFHERAGGRTDAAGQMLHEFYKSPEFTALNRTDQREMLNMFEQMKPELDRVRQAAGNDPVARSKAELDFIEKVIYGGENTRFRKAHEAAFAEQERLGGLPPSGGTPAPLPPPSPLTPALPGALPAQMPRVALPGDPNFMGPLRPRVVDEEIVQSLERGMVRDLLGGRPRKDPSEVLGAMAEQGLLPKGELLPETLANPLYKEALQRKMQAPEQLAQVVKPPVEFGQEVRRAASTLPESREGKYAIDQLRQAFQAANPTMDFDKELQQALKTGAIRSSAAEKGLVRLNPEEVAAARAEIKPVVPPITPPAAEPALRAAGIADPLRNTDTFVNEVKRSLANVPPSPVGNDKFYIAQAREAFLKNHPHVGADAFNEMLRAAKNEGKLELPRFDLTDAGDAALINASKLTTGVRGESHLIRATKEEIAAAGKPAVPPSAAVSPVTPPPTVPPSGGVPPPPPPSRRPVLPPEPANPASEALRKFYDRKGEEFVASGGELAKYPDYMRRQLVDALAPEKQPGESWNTYFNRKGDFSNQMTGQGREEFLKNIPGETSRLHGWMKDPELAGHAKLQPPEAAAKIYQDLKTSWDEIANHNAWLPEDSPLRQYVPSEKELTTQSEHIAGFMANLSDAQVKNGLGFLRDPYEMANKYSQRINREIADNKMTTMGLAQEARPLSELLAGTVIDAEKGTPRKATQGDFVRIEKALTDLGMSSTEGKRAITERLGVDIEALKGKDLSVPQTLVDLLKREDVKDSPQALKPVLHYWDKMTQLTKDWLTVPFPGFHTRNMASAAYNAWRNDAADLGMLSKAKKFIDGGRGSAEVNDLAREAYKEGVAFHHASGFNEELTKNVGWTKDGKLVNEPAFFDKTTLGETLTDFAKSYGKPTTIVEKARAFNQKMEDMIRFSHYMAKRAQGFSPEIAAANVKAYQIDYSSLSSFEKNAMKRVIPFYAYTRRSLPVFLEELTGQPAKLATSIKLANQGRQEEDYLPPWVGQSSIPLPGAPAGMKRYLSSTGLPFEDEGVQTLTSALSGNIPQLLKQVLGSTVPQVKLPMELAFGQQLFTGKPLSEIKPGFVPSLGGILPNEVARPLTQLAANSPASRLFSMADKVADPRQALLPLLFNVATGARVVDIDPAKALEIEGSKMLQDQLKQSGVAKVMETAYVPDKSKLTPEEAKMWELYQLLGKRRQLQAWQNKANAGDEAMQQKLQNAYLSPVWQEAFKFQP